MICPAFLTGLLQDQMSCHVSTLIATQHITIEDSDLITIYCKAVFSSKEEQGKDQRSKTGKGLSALGIRRVCHCQQIALKTKEPKDDQQRNTLGDLLNQDKPKKEISSAKSFSAP